MSTMIPRVSPIAAYLAALSRYAAPPTSRSLPHQLAPRRLLSRWCRRPEGNSQNSKNLGNFMMYSAPRDSALQAARYSLAPLEPRPFGPLAHVFHEMRRDMERLFNNDLLGAYGSTSTFDEPSWQLSTDVTETDAAYQLKVDVPGVEKEDIKCKVTEDRVLVITAERKSELDEEDSKTGLVRKERRYGKFSRTLQLPQHVSVDGITAEVRDGVMTLTVPKIAHESPMEQEIPIQ